MSEVYEKQQWDEIIEQVHKGKHFSSISFSATHLQDMT
jgi:hypothetical protein